MKPRQILLVVLTAALALSPAAASAKPKAPDACLCR